MPKIVFIKRVGRQEMIQRDCSLFLRTEQGEGRFHVVDRLPLQNAEKSHTRIAYFQCSVCFVALVQKDRTLVYRQFHTMERTVFHFCTVCLSSQEMKEIPSLPSVQCSRSKHSWKIFFFFFFCCQPLAFYKQLSNYSGSFCLTSFVSRCMSGQHHRLFRFCIRIFLGDWDRFVLAPPTEWWSIAQSRCSHGLDHAESRVVSVIATRGQIRIVLVNNSHFLPTGM